MCEQNVSDIDFEMCLNPYVDIFAIELVISVQNVKDTSAGSNRKWVHQSLSFVLKQYESFPAMTPSTLETFQLFL